MFKYGIKFLLSRKKWLLLMVFTLAIIIASVISIFTASEAIKEGLKEKAYDLYGEHSGVLIGIEETKERLQKKGLNIGEYQIVDKMVFNNDKIVSIGWMDEDALKMGHIQLLEGTYPKKINEVAIEESYLQLIDNHWDVGEKRTIQINNKEIEVFLVGIINNYSAKWSVPIGLEKGVNDFPNIFISKQTSYSEDKSRNFLIKIHGNKRNAEEGMLKLLDDYSQSGTINERLFYKGLIDNDSISLLSWVFQGLTLILSLLCVISLFHYFNIEQSRKIAVLKALGATKRNLYFLYFFQCLFIFILSLIVTIPIHLMLHSLIIYNTFEQSVFHIMDSYYLIVILIWLLLIFLIIYFISILMVNKSNNYSVNEMFSKQIDTDKLYNSITKNVQSFSIKQLARQLFMYPKHLIITILSLCFSTLLITFSIYFQKESSGLWETEQSYYLTSQEIYGHKVVDNLTVLQKQGLTFSVKDVQILEKIPGILYVDKNPFMKDVHLLMDQDLLIPPIGKWIEEYGSDENRYNGKEIIPNVRYKIVDYDEFKNIDSEKRFKELRGKIILFIPTDLKSSEVEHLIGEKVSFVKMFESSGKLETLQKDYEILDVKDKPFEEIVNKKNKIKFDEVTIILDLETALESGFFPGYNELGIYSESNLSKEKYKKIDTAVNQLIATIPGSLIQNIPEFIKEDTKIYSLLGFMGKLSFIVAIVLTVTSIVVVVFSKYNLQKRNWGIYLSLGLSKKQIIKFLTLEMLSYLIFSTVISMMIFFFALSIMNHLFSILIYFKYLCIAIVSVLLLILIGAILLWRVIMNQSISSILRKVE